MEPLEWCRQRLLVRGHPLTASLPFAPDELRDRILSLRAVITEIAAVPETVSEPEVAHAKLAWWHDALHRQFPHPALEALEQTGAAARLDVGHFAALIEGVRATLDKPRFENRDLAWRFCMAVGGPASALEADLVGSEQSARGIMETIGANACLVRQVRDLAIDAGNNRWLVPLDIQAEFQVSRNDVLAARATPAFNGLVRTWLSDGLRRSERALAGLDAGQRWLHRHQLIQHALDRRLAGQLARNPARIFRRRILPGQLGNAWCAWRTARALRADVAV